MDDNADAGWIVGLPEGWVCAKAAVVRHCALFMERGSGENLAPSLPAGASDGAQVMRRDARIVAAFQSALLSEKLCASLFDGHNFKALPKAAFQYPRVLDAGLRNGAIELDPLWPDEWRPWNGEPWAFPKDQFEAWLSSAEAFSVEDLPPKPSQVDGGEIAPLRSREPSQRNRVALSEAVSWIAFGLALDADRLKDAIRWDRLAGGELQEAQRKVATAVETLLDAGADEKIAFHGRHAADKNADGGTTAKIEPHQLDDFRQFLIGSDKLYGGKGLKRWHSSHNHFQNHRSERPELFTQVTVSRDDLLKQFPGQRSTLGIPLAVTVGELAQPEEGFDPYAAVAVAPWWSVLEVIGWIVTRSRSYVAHIGGLENLHGDDISRSIAFSQMVVYVSRNNCQCGAQSFPPEERWEHCACVGQAGRDLLEAIRTTAIGAIQSINGKPRKMDFHELAGVGQRPTSVDWLFVEPQPVFSSAEVMAEFLPLAEGDAPTGNGGSKSTRAPAVKAGHPPSVDAILAKADEMKLRIKDGRLIAKSMRLEPGFENVATTEVRELIKGRWTNGRPKKKPAS